MLKLFPAELMDAYDVSAIVISASTTDRSASDLFQIMIWLAAASCLCCDNVMIDKKPDRILKDLQKEIEKLREEEELPEVLDIDLIRNIERTREKLKKPPKKNWIH